MDTTTRWNGPEGATWAAEADRFDRIAEAHVEPLLRAAGVQRGSQVLDVGCGAGATTLVAAWTAGPEGLATGIDISAPLLTVARRRAGALTNVQFVEADASRDDLGVASYDVAISRSAVMLFDDPATGLANVRSALRTGGRVACTVWQEPGRNGWSSIPTDVVGRHLLQPASPEVGDAPRRWPGAFALADPAEASQVFAAAGFVDVTVTPIDHLAVVGRDVDDTIEFFHRVSGGGLRTVAPPHVVDQIEAELRDRLAAHLTDDGVAVPAAAWLIAATNPD